MTHNQNKKTTVYRPGELDEKLAKLEVTIVSLYNRIDKIKHDMSTARFFQDQALYSELVHRYEKLVKQLAVVQQMADGIIVRMTQEQRKDLLKTAPTFFNVFGWQKHIDQNGNFKYDA